MAGGFGGALGGGVDSGVVVVEKGGLRLVSRLGHGGMADLFLGVQQGEQGFARLVVVKKIRARKLSEQHLLGMFFDEAKTVAALSHPHIVKVFDLTRTESTADGGSGGAGDVAIVMEYVDGETLSYVWRQLQKNQTHMPVPVIIKLVLDAAEALGAAHSATGPDGKPLNLVHRDVSPQNLMIDRNGYLKVIDFGIAKTSQQTELTSPGGIKGKLSYLAPEAFRTRDIDARVDVYGLGLVLWELLTLKPGVDLAPDAPLQEVVDSIEGLALTPASTLRPDVPVELDDVVTRATAADRDQRFASMEDFAQALRKVTVRVDGRGVGVSSSAGVKKWFVATFAHRLEKRRAFEQDAFARADKPLPATTTTTLPPTSTPVTSSGLPIAHVDTREHQPTLDAHPHKATPLTELHATPTKKKPPTWAIAAAAALVAGVVVVAVVLGPARTSSSSTMPVTSSDGVDAGLAARVAVVDAGAIAVVAAVVAADDELPETPEPATTLSTSATKRPPKKPPAAATAETTVATAGVTTPVAAPVVAVAQPSVTAVTTPTTTTTTTPTAPTPTTTTTTPSATTTAAAPPTPTTKLVSGTGTWTGAQVLGQGCTRCHAVDVKQKTRRQWERFFERDVHDRHAKLDGLFSDGEQQRALQSILLSLDDKGGSAGVAGVR